MTDRGRFYILNGSFVRRDEIETTPQEEKLYNKTKINDGINIGSSYCMWENIGGGKFWQTLHNLPEPFLMYEEYH